MIKRALFGQKGARQLRGLLPLQEPLKLFAPDAPIVRAGGHGLNSHRVSHHSVLLGFALMCAQKPLHIIWDQEQDLRDVPRRDGLPCERFDGFEVGAIAGRGDHEVETIGQALRDIFNLVFGRRRYGYLKAYFGRPVCDYYVYRAEAVLQAFFDMGAVAQRLGKGFDPRLFCAVARTPPPR